MKFTLGRRHKPPLYTFEFTPFPKGISFNFYAFFSKITYTGKWSLYPPIHTPLPKVRKG